MKKWFLLFLSLVILFFTFVYLFIPSQIKINKAVRVSANPEASYRVLLKDDVWTKWWPASEQKPGGTKNLPYQHSSYQLDQKLFNSFVVNVQHKGTNIGSTITLVPVNVGTLDIHWVSAMEAPSNPIERIKKYFIARSVEGEMGTLLNELKSFLEQEQNLYGSTVQLTKVKDSVLVATKITTDHYPTTGEVYALVDKLKAYIQQQSARETDYPMLHVDSLEGNYTTMVAIPTDRLLPGNNKDIVLKRMVLGNIVVTEVKGGTYTTQNAVKQLEYYLSDHKRTSPAIPYESLVTDRRKEPDTSRWVTKVYYPVF